MDQISFNNLSFSFNHQPILEEIKAELAIGKIHLLTGISGSGKSTLLKLIASLLPKYGGQITNGQLTVSSKAPIGMVFQDPLMQFALDTPRHELEFTLENCQVPTAEIPQRITAALHFGNVSSLADRLISTLSGGQQQRVALAVVMAMQPTILLLDEPFANVDEENRQLILTELAKINQTHKTTIIITDHDLHGYYQLNPLVWRLSNHHLCQLSANESNQLLQQQQLPQISCPLPKPTLPAAIELKQVTISQNKKVLLAPTTLALIKHRVTLLTGPNGIGKSTLLKALAKLIDYQGTINYDQLNIQKISPGKYYRHLGLVFQQANDQFLNVTVGEELALSSKNGQNPYFTNERVQQALTSLGLAGREDQVIYSLSGGQKKKLQILLMLMMGQETLLLDEPFTGLDQASLQTVLQLITASRLHHPQTLLIVSHQLTGLDGFIDFHLTMSKQQLQYRGGSHES